MYDLYTTLPYITYIGVAKMYCSVNMGRQKTYMESKRLLDVRKEPEKGVGSETSFPTF